MFHKILSVPPNTVMNMNNVTVNLLCLLSPIKYAIEEWGPVPGKFLSIVSQDPSDSKSTQLHVASSGFGLFT